MASQQAVNHQPVDAVDAAWAHALLRFNLEPATYADSSWLPAWAAQADGKLLSELSKELLFEHGLEGHFDWTLEEPSARIFLLDEASRSKVGLTIGIAAHRDSLRQVVRQAQLGALRSALGDALDMLWLPAAEAVDRAPSPLVLQWEPLNGVALRGRLVADGYQQMLRLLDPNNPVQRPAAVRATFCAPKALSSNPLACLSEARAERMAGAIVNEIIPRWARAWTWLF